MIIFEHGIRKIGSPSCTRIENIEGNLAAIVNKFVGSDKVCTARSSAAIGGVCPRKLKEMVFIFTATRALINAYILVVLNRAAAFTVQKETGSAAVQLKIIIGFPCIR